MRVLLAGFEPFGGEAVNPSMLAVTRLVEAPPAGMVLRAMILPVVYAQAWPDLLDALRKHAPEALLLTGLAGGREAALSIERVAINLDDSPIPDNAGERRTDAAVVADGPAAYFTTLPARAMAAASVQAGVHASLSNTAGTFLCNHVLYRACHHAAAEAPALRCGFVHLPYLPEQALRHPAAPGLMPSLTLDAMTTGLRAVLEACR